MLHHLWTEGLLCDIVLKPAGGDPALLRAHRIVLAGASQFFRALFTGAGQHMRSSQVGSLDGVPILELHEVCGNALQIILKAIYSRELLVRPSDWFLKGSRVFGGRAESAVRGCRGGGSGSCMFYSCFGGNELPTVPTLRLPMHHALVYRVSVLYAFLTVTNFTFHKVAKKGIRVLLLGFSCGGC